MSDQAWDTDEHDRRRRLASYAWIEHDGAVLLSLVAKTDPAAGRWTLPGGGVDFGEHPEEALHRELYEETGLAGTIDEFLGIDSMVLEPGAARPFSFHVVRLVYRMTAVGDPQVTEVDGSTERAAWIPLAEVDSLTRVTLVDAGRRLATATDVR